MRSTLSALGVIIAVAAVIAMTEIGQGSKAILQTKIASMGANMMMILPGATTTSGVNMGAGSMTTLTPADAEEILRQCPAVVAVAPTVRARSQIIHGGYNSVPNQICGTTPSYLVIRDWEDLAEGTMFTSFDVRSCNTVCVIGATVKKALFPHEPALGKEIRMNNVPFRVIGVLAKKGANMMGQDQDDIVLAPWTTVKYHVSGSMLANTNQSTSASAESSPTADSVNTLEQPVSHRRHSLSQPHNGAGRRHAAVGADGQRRRDPGQGAIVATGRRRHPADDGPLAGTPPFAQGPG